MILAKTALFSSIIHQKTPKEKDEQLEELIHDLYLERLDIICQEIRKICTLGGTRLKVFVFSPKYISNMKLDDFSELLFKNHRHSIERKVGEKLKTILDSYGYDVVHKKPIVDSDILTIDWGFTRSYRNKMKFRGLVRFIIIANRYRDDFYKPNGVHYNNTHQQFDIFKSQSRK